MASDSTLLTSAWRSALPVLHGRTVTLREPVAQDLGPLLNLLSLADATHFGLDVISDVTVQQLLERAPLDRANGQAFSYAIVLTATRELAGFVQVRQIDPAFEAADWECTL